MPAYNPYFPATYQSPYQQPYYQPTYQAQAAPMAQQPMPQQAQTYNPVANQNGIIWISGPQEAQMFPIAPNNAVALWEKSGKTIYLKQADATGKPTITVYDLVERTQTAQETSSEAEDKSPSYATKDELGAVMGVVKGFDELLGSLKSDIETMKGDMYGIAGKKKSSRKQEVTDNAE